MPEPTAIGINRERLRQPEQLREPDAAPHRPLHHKNTVAGAKPLPVDIAPPARPRLVLPQTETAPPAVPPQPYTEPAPPRQRPSQVLARDGVRSPKQSGKLHRSWKPIALQAGLVSMAVVVFLVGMAANLRTLKTNYAATAQVNTLAGQVNTSSAQNAGTTKPSAAAVAQYTVNSAFPRFLKIPKLSVDARVMQAGAALTAPDNAYDTAWYTGSAEPGQTGATLIDGDVSDWTTAGVFYSLKTLVPGDSLQIERGDGVILNYQVVKIQSFPAGSLNLQTVLASVTPGTPGLNIMTTPPNAVKGTDLFNEQMVVFAKQVS
jgi:hypothetical protein